ncbi:hypothetical protein C2869_05075 [Saccharobesus litoralis]|uniref:YdhG-like domain-containing protein n=1 Tax=Saccharobesus litoralis TaxID=2172099 RepID=A0A2S0VNS6_9ALTE|nr:DUF1801 domain-containing protein [Saccharobesus litoralis]AWB65849.1 hypothetical protein C2869_05075 [Saccharobesus litoralis]
MPESTIPTPAQEKLELLRQLILDVAQQQELGNVEQSIKWGQQSFQTQYGSPIRIGWDSREPQHYSLYCHCQTKLIASFKEVFGEQIEFVGNRQIKLEIAKPFPQAIMMQCIMTALNYKRLKHLPLLGL